MNMGIIAASRLRATGISPFIIEVDTSKAGVSNNNQFQFTGAEGDYDVVAKQNDTVVQTFSNLSGSETITFTNGSGTYVLEITPKLTNGFSRLMFNDGGDKKKMLDIKQWGTIIWSRLRRAYYDCGNMRVNAIDAPIMSNVNDIEYMFLKASLANPFTRNWNVSTIVNFRGLFDRASLANPDISLWDVSNAERMDRTFSSCNLSTSNLTAAYSNWSLLNLKNNVIFEANGIKYNASGQAGRDILVNTYNWSITDGGQV